MVDAVIRAALTQAKEKAPVAWSPDVGYSPNANNIRRPSDLPPPIFSDAYGADAQYMNNGDVTPGLASRRHTLSSELGLAPPAIFRATVPSKDLPPILLLRLERIVKSEMRRDSRVHPSDNVPPAAEGGAAWSQGWHSEAGETIRRDSRVHSPGRQGESGSGGRDTSLGVGLGSGCGRGCAPTSQGESPGGASSSLDTSPRSLHASSLPTSPNPLAFPAPLLSPTPSTPRCSTPAAAASVAASAFPSVLPSTPAGSAAFAVAAATPSALLSSSPRAPAPTPLTPTPPHCYSAAAASVLSAFPSALTASSTLPSATACSSAFPASPAAAALPSATSAHSTSPAAAAASSAPPAAAAELPPANARARLQPEPGGNSLSSSNGFSHGSDSGHGFGRDLSDGFSMPLQQPQPQPGGLPAGDFGGFDAAPTPVPAREVHLGSARLHTPGRSPGLPPGLSFGLSPGLSPEGRWAAGSSRASSGLLSSPERVGAQAGPGRPADSSLRLPGEKGLADSPLRSPGSSRAAGGLSPGSTGRLSAGGSRRQLHSHLNSPSWRSPSDRNAVSESPAPAFRKSVIGRNSNSSSPEAPTQLEAICDEWRAAQRAISGPAAAAAAVEEGEEYTPAFARPPVSFRLTVEMTKGRCGEVVLFRGMDTAVAALVFCATHGLSMAHARDVEALLREQLKAAMRLPASNARGSQSATTPRRDSLAGSALGAAGSRGPVSSSAAGLHAHPLGIRSPC